PFVVTDIRAAVADVRDAGNAVRQPRADDGRAHAGVLSVAAGALDDGASRRLHRLAEQGRARLKSTLCSGGWGAAIDVRRDGLDGEPAGHFAGRRAAHPITDDEESQLRAGQERICVDWAHAAHAGRRANLEPHWRYSLRMNWLVKEEPENYSYSRFLSDK